MNNEFLVNDKIRFYSFSILLLTAFIAGFFTLYKTFEGLGEQTELARRRADIIRELETVYLVSKEAESEVRGYVMTEKPEYLNMYEAYRDEFKKDLYELEHATIEDPYTKSYVVDLKSLLIQEFTLLDQLVTLAKDKTQRIDHDHDLFQKVRSIVNSVKATYDHVEKVSQERMEEREASSKYYSNLVYWVLVIWGALSVLVLMYSLWVFRKRQLQTIHDIKNKEKLARKERLALELSKLISDDLVLDEAADIILNFLAKNFNILAGKLYFYGRGGLRGVKSFGIKGDESHSAEEASRLAETYIEKDIIQVTNIPDNFWKVESALGESKPSTLIFMSYKFQGKTVGVIEMGAFGKLDKDELELLYHLSESIAIGIDAAESRTRVQQLLEETQQQAEELQTQQEELKTNNEELEQQARALESQQQSLNLKNKELEKISEQLKEKAQELQKTSQYKSEFLANMSHELRTPLNGLLILSSLLQENKEKNLNEQQIEFINSIHRAGNDLLNLINDILDLSKIEAKKLTIKPMKFSLKAFVESIEKSFKPQMMTSNLEWKTEIHVDDQDATLNTDEQRLEQILRNFVSNAIKFTEQGSISLIVNMKGSDKVEFIVKDTGVGISKDKQKAIFDAFEQEDTSISRKYGGTGLGLTISKQLASLLGGYIDLKSEKGVGSEFSVIVPIELTKSHQKNNFKMDTSDISKPVDQEKLVINMVDEENAKLKARKIVGDIPEDRKNILVVEDNDEFRKAVIDTVKEYGYYPIEASDGEVALSILHNHTPDAILLDIKVPGVSGLGLLEIIKQIPHLRHVPVHMISGLDYRNNALKMGALGYLTKPVSMEKISAALDRIEHLLSDKVRRVLLIEDDKSQRMAINELVSGKDVEVMSVGTGKEAISRIEEVVFDCIILDLNLPDTSGISLLQELNQLSISLPPVVIYTAKDLSAEEEAQLKKFTESIIVKGVRSPERLLDEVNLFLHRVESDLPKEKQIMLQNLRSQDYLLQNRTVLIVDDDLRNVFALTSALESKGMNVEIAKNGKEAVEAVQNNPEINIVLMDIMMPVMNGYDAMKTIRNMPEKRFSELPIVALTAKAMKEDHEKCIESGANDYLSKPINLTNLISILKVWLPREDFV